MDELSLGVVCTADPSVEAIASLEGSTRPAPAAAGVSTFAACSAGMREEVGVDTGKLQLSRRSSISQLPEPSISIGQAQRWVEDSGKGEGRSGTGTTNKVFFKTRYISFLRL